MSASTAVEVYLDVLFGRARPSTLVEVRWRTADGMGRRFVTVADAGSLADFLVITGGRTDVYVGVLPRWRPAGDRGAIVGDGRFVWVDLDTELAARALEPVEPAPSLVVASGGRGHLHAYWELTAGVPPRVVERANRRLAWARGGDLNSTDAARILRPPATVNHGRPHAAVRLVSASGARCRIGELIGGLPDPPGMTATREPRRQRRGRRDALLELAPEHYVSVLTGQRVGRSRKVRCPLHDDETPSLHVYRQPERGWYCFGCRRGGSVYDLAAGLWCVEPRGAEFLALRERLRTVLAT